MRNSENILKLNELLLKIENQQIKIDRFKKLIKYDFNNRFGTRNNCYGILSFKIDNVGQEYKINMSDKIEKSISNLLKISITEENKILIKLKEEYDSIMNGISNSK